MTFLASWFPDSFRCLGPLIVLGLIWAVAKIIDAVNARRRFREQDYRAILRRDDSVRQRL